MHRLLKRQIKRHLGKDFEISSLDEKIQNMLEDISNAYEEQDKERRFLESTIDINSEELNTLNRVIKDENKTISTKLYQFKEAIETVLYVCSLDLEGNINFANENFLSTVGFSFKEIKTKNFDTLQDEDSYLFSNIIKNFGKERFWEGTLELRCKEGNKKHLNGAVILLEDKEFLFIANDITFLEEARIKAELGEKAKDEFLANMSHEIRTPLNAIIGFANILKDANLEPKEKEQADIIAKSSNILLNIINSILDISKIQSGQFEINNEANSMKSMLDNIFSLFAISASNKNINFNYSYDETIPKVLVFDNTRLQQVISNLVSNAIKFTPQGGEVYLTVKLLEKDNSKAKIYFEIKDSGIGISEEKKELIFKPFTQADSSVTKKFGGTGLGLSIVSSILEMLNSKINLETIENIGSRFFFEVEFEIDNKTKIEEEIKEDTGLKVSEGQILIAEDNPMNQELMIALLEMLDLEADFVEDGKEAFEKFKQKDYDLIFMDINMPVCDGVTATKTIREFESLNNLKPTPIVSLTANEMQGDKEKYLSIGMNDHLGKPINFDAFKTIIEKYLK